MKFGSLTFQPQKPQGFDFHVFRVKPETGLRLQPQPDMHSNIAVFADTQTVQNHPDWVSQSPLGPAKFGNNNFNIYWSVVCPTQPDYREEQLRYIAEVDRQSQGIWLNSQYFADHSHCTCPRCQELYQKSGLGWLEWRRKVVTDYVAQIRDAVKKDLVLSLQPDPVSSLERYGVDFDDFAKYADLFNVVMFSKNYATPWYWEMLARGFKKLLKKPFYISFYVYGPGDSPQDVPTAAELLTVTARSARAGVDGFLYLTDGEKEMTAFQKATLEKAELRERLRTYGGKPVGEFLDWVAGWNQIVK
jgi:glycosyltransferase involved in cell wall biosynthesis